MKYLVTNRRTELRRIYQEWARHNIRQQALQTLLLGAVVALVLIGFDFMIFGSTARFYLPYRLTCSTVFAVLFLIVRGLQAAPLDPRMSLLGMAAGLLSLGLWNGTYFYFFLHAPQQHHHLVVAGIYLNIYVTQFFVFRFWQAHYLCAAAYIATISAMIWTNPQVNLEFNELKLFALWNLCVFIICWVQRRSFCASLFLRYESLRKQYPAKMARIICTESPNYTLEEAFKPVLRPCACICLDWRSFQAYAASQPPGQVAQQIQTVHDVVIAILAETIADESYFADWTADEIFITVYSEQDDVQAVLRNTWNFCQTLQRTIRPRLIEAIGSNVPIIDIGAAAGVALVGLVGPTTMKKTTIVGAVGGIAKRLESVAKNIREASHRSSAPILCINKDIYDYVQLKQDAFSQLLQPLRTDNKDLKGHILYVYSETLTDAPLNPLPEAADFH
jgi:class 3 adenylate cyclase